MNLLGYVLRRLFFGAVVLISVMTFTFILSHNLGGNVLVAWLGKSASIHPDLAKAYAIRYHLNDPVWVQYYYYLVNIAQGNLGYSPSHGFFPVTLVIAETLPYTIQLVIFGFILTIVLGVSLGVLAARYHHTKLDAAIRTVYLAWYSSPPFFVGILLIIIFALVLHVLPTGEPADPSLTVPSPIIGLPVFDSLLEGNVAYLTSALEHLILPSITLALVTFGVVTRVVRSSLLDVMQMNYIRTARSKGLDENAVFYKHGLRNALIPVVTLSSLIFIFLITGTIFVENIFSYPGMGQYLVAALLGLDYPGIIATTIIFALIIVVTNLAADILYVVVDPQIRLG